MINQSLLATWLCIVYLSRVCWSSAKKCQIICFAFGLFTCHVPAVSSQLEESTFCFPLHHTLSFIHLLSVSVYKPEIQPKERRKDTAGGRSDAILTSNWKPSHSLFPIKRPCQAREYERDRVRDTEEWETNSERELEGKTGTQRERERAVQVWETERQWEKVKASEKQKREKNTCQPSSSERWVQ